ncbi:hypothetical protein [Oscillibacter sp.]|uniref:hypothetical protein n=1 Tax=Oscillibacter sp. TaxID=1945593 RepID=UPI0028A93152|nr:hypothetical protein [Oscillibacter sp.]
MDENQAGEKAIINYFKKIYCEDHPEECAVDVPSFRKYLNEEITKFENQRILFVSANQCNQRIIMQQGLFMFPYDLTPDNHIRVIKKNTNVI